MNACKAQAEAIVKFELIFDEYRERPDENVRAFSAEIEYFIGQTREIDLNLRRRIMDITYESATIEDIARIYQFNKQLIDDYENIENIDYDKVLSWVQKKIEKCINEYTTIYADGKKAGYYHFYKNEDAEFEIDDLYIFPEFQNKGIGSKVIRKCCSAVNAPVMLYVFIKNQRAVFLYQRLGFEVVKTIKDSRFIMKKNP